MSVLTLNAAERGKRVISIGYEGENVVTQIDFVLTEWIEKHGLGGVVLLVQRHGDANAYPVPLVIADGITSWVITKTECAKVGRGAIQLVYTVGEKIKKSEIFGIVCTDSLDGSGEIPEPYENWLERLTALTATVTAKAAEALVSADISQMAANVSAQAASHSAKSADNAEKSERAALDSSQNAKDEADRAKIFADTAAGALAGMSFVGFTVDDRGHVLITNSDKLATTSFELTQSGHMEVTY